VNPLGSFVWGEENAEERPRQRLMLMARTMPVRHVKTRIMGECDCVCSCSCNGVFLSFDMCMSWADEWEAARGQIVGWKGK
jgi:hypothetical protein